MIRAPLMPDRRSPPSAARSWSFNYFFYNHRMKKVLFFTCSCTRMSSGLAESTRRLGPDGEVEVEEDMFAFDEEARREDD
jgi:hypothetical protein